MVAHNKPLVLVDGSSYLFRAFHALPPLSSSKGQATGAIKGVIAMLRTLQREYPESALVVVFDASGKSFRNELYPEYKANRPPMPDDLRSQIAPIHRIIEAMGLPLLAIKGVEADDVIGTLAQQAVFAGRPVVVSTSDKDLAQLVSDQVTLVNTMTATHMDRAGVMEKFGVAPEQIIDLLALMGDTSDNIPGVPGVGPKTAAKWIAEYGSLDGVLAAAATIKGKAGESLRASAHFLPLSKELATVKCDVELPVSVAALQAKSPDSAELLALFQELEFKQWVDELAGQVSVVGKAQVIEGHYQTIIDEKALKNWVAKALKAATLGIDVRLSQPSYMQGEWIGLAMAMSEGEAAYVPFATDLTSAGMLPRNAALAICRPLMESLSVAKAGHNLKFIMNVLARYGIELQAARFDTMLQSYVIDSVASRHAFDDLVLKYLSRSTGALEDRNTKSSKTGAFAQLPIDEATKAACESADLVLQLQQKLAAKLAEAPTLQSVYDDIEIRLVPALSRIERRGALVDARVLKQQSAEIADRLQKLTQQAHGLAGTQFNLDSPKQLQELLFERLGLPVLRKTPSGQPSTAEEVLEELSDQYELPRVILEYRGLHKLKSTYTDPLPTQIDPNTGRIHTSYQQAVAATGRLSSMDPNLQNIPIRTAEGRRVRRAFIAPSGMTLLAADYSQIELRIMAHLSGDPGLLKAFSTNDDVHRATAAEVFGLQPSEVSDDQRRSAKAINFGLIYGMSAFGLARQLGVTRQTADNYIQRYFERYPGVRAYMDETRKRARELGYVETLFGRRLYLPEIRVANVPRRQAAERAAINAPMQGTAADIIKRAMVSVDDYLLRSGTKAGIIMQVHDELVLEVPQAELGAISAEVRRCMEQAANLAVPLLVGIGQGANWDEAH